MSDFDSPEQWLACVSDVEAAGNLPASTMVHEAPFVEEGANFLREVLADRDRLAARLEISDDPEMSVDKIEHLEGMLEFERKHSKRLAAELARVREAATLLLAEAEDVMDRYESRCPLQAGELQRAIDEIRAALAQPQDGTTEGRV